MSQYIFKYIEIWIKCVMDDQDLVHVIVVVLSWDNTNTIASLTSATVDRNIQGYRGVWRQLGQDVGGQPAF